MIATNLVKKEEGSKISNVLSNFKRLKLKINKDEIKKFQSKIKYLLTESENKNIYIFLNNITNLTDKLEYPLDPKGDK